MSQLALDTAICKNGCARRVVGSSITGEGHVCAPCNAAEWGRSLHRSREPYYRRLGAQLLEDSRRGSDRPNAPQDPGARARQGRLSSLGEQESG